MFKHIFTVVENCLLSGSNTEPPSQMYLQTKHVAVHVKHIRKKKIEKLKKGNLIIRPTTEFHVEFWTASLQQTKAKSRVQQKCATGKRDVPHLKAALWALMLKKKVYSDVQYFNTHTHANTNTSWGARLTRVRCHEPSVWMLHRCEQTSEGS